MKNVCLAAALLATAAALPAHAQPSPAAGAYPERPVRVIVPVTPGGSTDIIARIVLTRLNEAMAASFVVDNRAGAGGVLGTEIVAKAAPDGYTLLFTYAAHTISPFIYPSVPYDVYRDFSAVTLAGSQPLMLAVNNAVKANTVQELIALAKSKPGELNIALATPGSSGALAAELFKMLTGTKMVSVAFKGGGPALTALVGGEVQLIFTTPPTIMPFLKSNRVRVLATSGKDRMSSLPDVPTLAESGIRDFDTAPWQGMLAPAKTPQRIIDRLHREIAQVLKTPYARERFAASGTDIIGSTPKEFEAQIKRELAQNSRIVKAVGMKGE